MIELVGKLNVKNAQGENSHKTRIKSQVSSSCNIVPSSDTFPVIDNAMPKKENGTDNDTERAGKGSR